MSGLNDVLLGVSEEEREFIEDEFVCIERQIERFGSCSDPEKRGALEAGLNGMFIDLERVLFG